MTKTKSVSRSNWALRNLTLSQIKYAAMDVFSCGQVCAAVLCLHSYMQERRIVLQVRQAHFTHVQVHCHCAPCQICSGPCPCTHRKQLAQMGVSTCPSTLQRRFQHMMCTVTCKPYIFS